MQTITRTTANLNSIFNEFDSLYAELSEKNPAKKLVKSVYHEAFKPLVDLFVSYGYKGSENLTYNHAELTRSTVSSNNSIIVCFSGGKDSIATTEHYLKEGYDVYLYHMRHINPPLYDEHIQAQKLAEYWGIPIYIDTIKLSGKHDYIEHPMKNMMIANGALQYGIREGIGTNIAFGNYTTSTLQDDNFEFCGGDDMEMWELYDKIIQTIIPGFKMNVVLGNLSDTLEAVCPNKELLDMSVSCLGRASMRSYWHDWVFKKFGINIPKHRCGRCYKCCIEYIYMTDHDLQEYNEDYYAYCLKNLKNNVEREDGIVYNKNEVWSHYFFYDKERSKYYGQCRS